MLRTLLICGIVLLSPVLATSQEGGAPGAGQAIQGVISRQIEAFRADDFTTAFGFASPAIKGIFGTPERFGSMVRNGYPMVWRPSDVEFLELREEAGRLYQRVMVTDADGALFMLDYQMIEGGNGWQINGVEILRAPRVGV